MDARTVATTSVPRLLEAENAERGAARMPPVPAETRSGVTGRAQAAVMLWRVCFCRVNLIGRGGGRQQSTMRRAGTRTDIRWTTPYALDADRKMSSHQKPQRVYKKGFPPKPPCS